MSIARRRWSPDEKREVMRLVDEGYTYKQVAEKLRPGVASAWRSVGEIVREEKAKQTSQQAQATSPQPQPSGAQSPQMPSLPGYLSVQSAKVTLPPPMAHSLTAQQFMLMMDDDQRRLFIATYMDLRGDADEESLTKAENEMLIRAAFSNVKYLRAQAMLTTSESYLMMEMEGGLTDSDEDKAKKRFAGRSDAYKKEAEQWHKEYMELLNDLKLTRKQRLDKIKDNRNTFLDLQQELMTKVRQESIVEEIKRINNATDAELRRMARGEVGPDGRRHPWLVGAFDEFLEQPLVLDAPQEQLEQTGGEDGRPQEETT